MYQLPFVIDLWFVLSRPEHSKSLCNILSSFLWLVQYSNNFRCPKIISSFTYVKRKSVFLIEEIIKVMLRNYVMLFDFFQVMYVVEEIKKVLCSFIYITSMCVLFFNRVDTKRYYSF